MQDLKVWEEVCVRCQAAVWEGQYCGFRFKADPTPVDIAGEIQAKLEGRRTFGVDRERPGFYLVLRSMNHIHRQFEFVLAEHRCGSVQSASSLPDYWPAPLQTTTSF